ncbi:Ionotropic receptor 191 [Hyalella azteca]|uniref:Ionotropic receptor 191 n=1 Tax=Hyalella azteca TaxID=294128 RepID=A0A6A0GTT1_HYAAZ|nr:Ionotropic receptor 191 [Hyalella azteca]
MNNERFERRLDLLGAKLRCVTEQQAPGVYIQQTAEGAWQIFGWMLDLVATLEQMMNFTCNISPPPDRQFGALRKDGSWTGLVGEVDAGRADLIVTSLDNTVARASVVDFLVALEMTGFVMIMRPARDMRSVWTRYTSEFSTGVWLALGAVLTLGCGVFHVAVTRSPCETRRAPLPETCSLVLAALASQGCESLVTASSSRLAWLTILWATVLVSVHYTSWLYSTLTLNVPFYPYDGFQSLLDDGHSTLGLVAGSSIQTEIEESKDPILQRVWKELIYPKGLAPNDVEGMKMSRHDGYVFLIIESSFYGNNINPCDYTVLPKTFFKFPSGFAVRKGSPLGPIFDAALVKLINTGVLRRSKIKWAKLKPDCSDLGVSPITLKQMISTFFILAVGSILAFIFLGCEKIWDRNKFKFNIKLRRHSGREGTSSFNDA